MKTQKITMQCVESRINSMFHSVKLFKADAEYIRDEYTKLSTELNSRTPSGKLRYSKFLSAYAFGYRMALNSQLWQNELEFCYVYNDELYSTHKTSTHKNAELLYLNRENSSAFMDGLDRGHYWKGTSKKFA